MNNDGIHCRPYITTTRVIVGSTHRLDMASYIQVLNIVVLYITCPCVTFYFVFQAPYMTSFKVITGRIYTPSFPEKQSFFVSTPSNVECKDPSSIIRCCTNMGASVKGIDHWTTSYAKGVTSKERTCCVLGNFIPSWYDPARETRSQQFPTIFSS